MKTFSMTRLVHHSLAYPLFKKKEQTTAFSEFSQAATPVCDVPGLFGTKTIDKSFTLELCQEMAPQGLAVTKDYIFSTAYCHKHLHPSVLYMMDRATGEWLKTISLPDQTHAGGLAFDPIHQLLWISNHAHGYAGAAAIPLSDIKAYDRANGPITYQKKIAFSDVRHTSSMAYDQNHLVAGYFSYNGPGNLALYPVSADGLPTGGKDSEILKTPYGPVMIPDKIQGITFYKNYLILSRSYGPYKPGELFFYDITKTSDFSQKNQAEKIVRTPPYLEQIVVVGTTLYALFESGAQAYRKKTPYVMDEILAVDLLKLLTE